MKAFLFFVLYTVTIVSYASDTSHLNLLAANRFKKNQNNFVRNGNDSDIQNLTNAVVPIHADHHNDWRQTGGNPHEENRLILVKKSSRDDHVHGIGKRLERFRRTPGKTRGWNVRYFRYGTVTLASKQPATLYRNGKLLLDIKRAYGSYKFTRMMKIYYGDLFAVESKRGASLYGVAIDVRLRVKPRKGGMIRYVHYSTQHNADSITWRGDGILRKSWMTRRKQYCRLSKPKPLRNDQVLEPLAKNAPPLDPKTRYMWVSDQKTSSGKEKKGRMVVPETAYLLLGVGIRCNERHQYRRKPLLPRRLPPRPWVRPRGEKGKNRTRATQPQRRTQERRQSRKTGAGTPRSRNLPSQEEDGYPPQCKCRAYPQSKRSVCYRMLTGRNPYGRCQKLQCEMSYQCIPGRNSGLRDCIRRVSTHETVLTDNSKGVLRCSYKKLRKPKFYYTLYQ